MGEKRNAYRILLGKPEGNGPLERPRRRWVDSIKIDLREIGCEGMDWSDRSGSGYGPVDGSCEYGYEPSVSLKFWDVLE
jgi:hypothetical protein